MGTLLTLQSLMDIPAMVLFSLLLRRAASWRWVRLAGLSFFLHALLTWLAPSVFFLYGIQVFETTGYALYAVASVYWVNDMTATADRVQGQTYFTMANTLGIVLSSFLGGFLLDAARHRTHLGLFHCNRRDRYGHPLDHAAAGPGQSSGTAGIAYAGWVLLSCQKTVKKSSSLLDRFSSFPENIWRYRLRYVT